MAKPKISWYAPKWSYVSREWNSLFQIFGAGPLTRISIASLIVGGLLVFGFKLAFPQAAIPNLWTMLLVLPGLLLAFVLQTALLTIIPPTIMIRKDKVHRSHGQSGIIIKANDLISAWLFFHAEDKVRLKLRYHRGNKKRTLVIGVPPTLDFNKLGDLLPIHLQVVDARARRSNHR